MRRDQKGNLERRGRHSRCCSSSSSGSRTSGSGNGRRRSGACRCHMTATSASTTVLIARQSARHARIHPYRWCGTCWDGTTTTGCRLHYRRSDCPCSWRCTTTMWRCGTSGGRHTRPDRGGRSSSASWVGRLTWRCRWRGGRRRRRQGATGSGRWFAWRQGSGKETVNQPSRLARPTSCRGFGWLR